MRHCRLTAFHPPAVDLRALAVGQDGWFSGSARGVGSACQADIGPPASAPGAAARRAALPLAASAFENGTPDPENLADRLGQVKITGPGRIVTVFRIPQPETGTYDRATAAIGVRTMTNLVGLTCQHPNPPLLVAGPELSIRLVGTRGLRRPP